MTTRLAARDPRRPHPPAPNDIAAIGLGLTLALVAARGDATPTVPPAPISDLQTAPVVVNGLVPAGH